MTISLSEIINANSDQVEWANISKWYGSATVRNADRILVPLQEQEGQLCFGHFKSRSAIITSVIEERPGIQMALIDVDDGGYIQAAMELKRKLEGDL